MASPSPRPLSAHLPLVALMAGAEAQRFSPLGVWLLGARRPMPAVMTWRHQLRPLLIDHDLGRLLRRCPAVAVRLGATPAIVPSGELVRVRALRVSLGGALLPPSAPARQASSHGPVPASGIRSIEIALGQRSAEELLALCARARVPVVRSQVVYGALSSGPRPLTPDAPRL